MLPMRHKITDLEPEDVENTVSGNILNKCKFVDRIWVWLIYIQQVNHHLHTLLMTSSLIKIWASVNGDVKPVNV